MTPVFLSLFVFFIKCIFFSRGCVRNYAAPPVLEIPVMEKMIGLFVGIPFFPRKKNVKFFFSCSKRIFFFFL